MARRKDSNQLCCLLFDTLCAPDFHHVHPVPPVLLFLLYRSMYIHERNPSFRVEHLTFRQASAFPDCKLAAHPRPACINSAQHGSSVHGGTPAVIETPHHLPAPLVPRNEFSRRVIVVHQDDLQFAATGSACGAGDRCAIGRWLVHGCSASESSTPRHPAS